MTLPLQSQTKIRSRQTIEHTINENIQVLQYDMSKNFRTSLLKFKKSKSRHGTKERRVNESFHCYDLLGLVL